MPLTKIPYSMIDGAWVDVLAFGADSTGVSDSSQAFLNAINSLTNGGTVYVPAGTYSICIAPTKSNITIRGDGVKATTLVNNTTTPGTYTINYDLGVQDTAKLPMSVVIQDLTVVGNRTNNYHGIRLANLKQGGTNNIEFNNVGHGLYLSNCFNTSHRNLFIRNFGKGIFADSTAVSNDNLFDTVMCWGGNADLNAQPIVDEGINNSTFINFVAEGSGEQGSTDLTNGTGNVYINPRWESCTPTGGTTPYVSLGGNENSLIEPLITLSSGEALASGTYLVEVSGKNSVITGLDLSLGKGYVKLTDTSKECKIHFVTAPLANIALGNIWIDYGENNHIDVNDSDYIFNNEITSSVITVNNVFVQSTDMASCTLDGLTQATVTGAASRVGPFQEGLIQSFTSPTGNRRWHQDIYPAWGSGPSANSVVAWSFWAKSLTSGGEYISLKMGRLASLLDVDTIYIPDTKYIRVTVFSKADTSAYTDYNVCMVLGASSSGVHLYGNQVFLNEKQNVSGIFQHFYAGGYIPTESVYRKVVAPNYAQKREHKIIPTNGTGFAGATVSKILPVVGQPKGWTCTVTGNPGTWVSLGNL